MFVLTEAFAHETLGTETGGKVHMFQSMEHYDRAAKVGQLLGAAASVYLQCNRYYIVTKTYASTDEQIIVKLRNKQGVGIGAMPRQKRSEMK